MSMETARSSSANGTTYCMSGAKQLVCLYSSARRFKRTGKRNDIFLATKFGYVLDPSTAAKGFPLSGSPEFTLKALDESLRKLGVDHIDLWYQHRYGAEPHADWLILTALGSQT